MSTYRTHTRIGTVRQLELLLVVYEEGSISKAAGILNLTQPTVSMQLSKLSNTIGLDLYYILGKTLRFTDAGESIVQSAKEILKQFEYMDLRIEKLKGTNSGHLSLSVVTTAKYFIPHLVGEFSHNIPDANIQFKIGNRQETIKRTLADTDDFYVFSHPPEHPDLTLIDFLPNRLYAIASEKHPLAGKKTIPLEAFLQYPFLAREEGSGTRYAIDSFIAAKNKQLNVKMTIESSEAIKHAVMSNLGVSILSEHTLTFGGLSGLALLDVEDLPISTNWYLVRRGSRPLSPIAAKFLDYVKEKGSSFTEQIDNKIRN